MMKRIFCIMLTSVAVLLMACGFRTGATDSTSEDTYPMPGAEDMAVEWLGKILNSGEGHMLSADSLAVLHEDKSIRSVALPLNAEDVLPHMGTYRHDATGGTIRFHPYNNEKDTVNPVCKAYFRVAMHYWEDSVYLPEDSSYTECIQNRGKGILAVYRIVHGGGPNGGKHRCYSKHPDGYPEYWGTLMYVYPGADSLMMTWGYEKSKRTYHFVSEK